MDKIFITGGSSYVSQLLIEEFKDFYEIYTLSTSKKNNLKKIKKNFINIDQAKDIIPQCKYIFHLAWKRDEKNNLTNLELIRNLNELIDSNKIIFISTITAINETISRYSLQKKNISKFCLQNNIRVVYLSFLLSNKSKPAISLNNLLKKLPFNLRFKSSDLYVYWTSPKNFISSIKNFINYDSKEIVIFEKKDSLNSFIQNIENTFKISNKKTIHINYFMIKILIKILLILKIKKGLIDKFLTFTTNTSIN
jgi:hypothetical protein